MERDSGGDFLSGDWVVGGASKSTWTVAKGSGRARTRAHVRMHARIHAHVREVRSRPRAGQWRFTPMLRVGRHSNPSPCHIYARGGVTYTCTRAPLALGAFESRGGRARRTKEESTTGRMRTATGGRAGGRRGIPLPPLDKPNRSRCASAGRNSPSVDPPPPICRCHPPGFYLPTLPYSVIHPPNRRCLLFE